MGRPKLVEGFDPDNVGINPFVANLVVYAFNKRVTKQMVEIGDVVDDVLVSVGEKRSLEFTLETSRMTKVFHNAAARKTLATLPARAKELLLWIMYELDPGKDYMVMNIARYEKENEVSHNTYLRAVEDLIAQAVISTTKWKNVFWVNPAIMFCGNRIHKYPDSVQIIEQKQKAK